MKKLKIVLKAVVLYFCLINTASCAHAQKASDNKENIVLVHGYARSASAMWKLENHFEDAGYNVISIDYSSFCTSIEEVKKEVYSQINNCCSKSKTKVHFVGHSFGGLLIRSYLGENKFKNLGNVVNMGSPSKGTAAVEYLKDSWIFKNLGGVAKEMSSKGSNFLKSLKKPNYNLGIIAGKANNPKYDHILKGLDHGLVTIESTKVDGMKDFVIMNTNHTMMRYNKSVAEQAVYFLRHSKFIKL